MVPTLFSFGPLTLRTLSVFLIFAVFAAAFVYWRKTREEHYDEVEVFDAWIVTAVVSLLGARLGGFLLQLMSLGSLTEWFNAWGAVRYQVLTGLLLGGWALARFANARKWDVWEILDYWCLGTCLGWAIVWLGLFFDGTSLGLPTMLPWGVRFPEVFAPVHPAQLYMASLYFALFIYLSWAEYHYRTFSWYRAGRNTAQSGYLTSVFVIMTGVISLLVSFTRPAQMTWAGTALDIPVYVGVILVGVWMLIRRSGRTFALPRMRSRGT